MWAQPGVTPVQGDHHLGGLPPLFLSGGFCHPVPQRPVLMPLMLRKRIQEGLRIRPQHICFLGDQLVSGSI